MKESDSVQTHLNEYESLSSQISAQGTTIEDELRAMLLMSSLPSSWETFVTTVCNASTTVVKYSEVTSAILTKAARRKSFAKDSADEANVVQGSTDRSKDRGRSSSRPRTNQRSRSKSRDNQICNYYKKPGHIKADCCALKANNDKAQRVDNKGGRQEEVNYICLSAEVLTENFNILSIENLIESEALLMTEELNTWLLGSACPIMWFLIDPNFGNIRHFDSVRVGNSQQCAIIGIGSVELNLPGGSTLLLHDVRVGDKVVSAEVQETSLIGEEHVYE